MSGAERSGGPESTGDRDPRARVDRKGPAPYGAPPDSEPGLSCPAMKIVNSLKTAKRRHRDCRIVRRKGRVYVINKKNPRFKARQG